MTQITFDKLIVGRGKGWLAINKPASMTVHNEKGEDLISLVKEYLPKQKDVFLMNRLDGGTSGIVMVGTEKSVASNIQQQIEKRTVTKIYFAICKRSKAEKVLVNQEGLWKWYLTKRAEGRSNPQGFQKMRVPCKTFWQALPVDEEHCYFKLNLLTGRKHQIRRHAALADWPVLGDGRYGIAEEEGQFDRLALHSYSIEFIDPETNATTKICAPINWRDEGFNFDLQDFTFPEVT